VSYDDYGQGDPGPPAVGAHVNNDLEALLQLAIEIVQQAKGMPLSASVLVSREELLDVLETALHNLPEEVREARWALRDREELMAAEIRKAEQLMDRVRAEAARMVDKTEIVRHARVAADRIVAEAQERARTLINEAEDFCDQKLGGMEIVLDRLTKTVKSGRERLRPSVGAAPALTPPAAPAPRPVEDSYETGGESFFDQDAN
jgi:hypothetical protein